MTASDVVVEVNAPQNRNLQFPPLGELVRGRFDVMRIPGEIGPLRTRFPNPNKSPSPPPIPPSRSPRSSTRTR